MAAAEPKPRAMSTLSPRAFQKPRFLATKANNCDPCGNHGKVILMFVAPCPIAGAGNLDPHKAAAVAPASICRRDNLRGVSRDPCTTSRLASLIRTNSSARRAFVRTASSSAITLSSKRTSALRRNGCSCSMLREARQHRRHDWLVPDPRIGQLDRVKAARSQPPHRRQRRRAADPADTFRRTG